MVATLADKVSFDTKARTKEFEGDAIVDSYGSVLLSPAAGQLL
jgi:hypothetical protein